MSLKTSKVDVTMCVSFRPSLDQLNFMENEKTQEKKTKNLKSRSHLQHLHLISFTLTALTSVGTTLGTSTCFSVFELKRCFLTFQELTLEELVPNPNTPPYHDGAVLSRTATSRNSSLRSEPITFPNDSEPRLKTKQDSRRVVYSLRNGSPSPWVDRYKLKQKSISALTYVELKNKTSPAEEPPVRGFSR